MDADAQAFAAVLFEEVGRLARFGKVRPELILKDGVVVAYEIDLGSVTIRRTLEEIKQAKRKSVLA